MFVNDLAGAAFVAMLMAFTILYAVRKFKHS